MRTYSHLGGIIVPNTRANFSPLAHCFEFNEASGVDAFADSAGGVVIGTNTPDNTGINNGDGTITLPNVDFIQTVRSGVWTAPGTKKVVMIYIGKGTAGSLNMGSTTGTITAANRAIRMTLGSVAPQVADGTTLLAGTNNANGTGTMIARVLVMDWGSPTGFQPHDYDGTTWTARTPTTLSSITGLTTVDPNVNLGVNLRPALWATLHFATLPPLDLIKLGVAWMRDYTAATGRKQIFLGWRNLAS